MSQPKKVGRPKKTIHSIYTLADQEKTKDRMDRIDDVHRDALFGRVMGLMKPAQTQPAWLMQKGE